MKNISSSRRRMPSSVKSSVKRKWQQIKEIKNKRKKLFVSLSLIYGSYVAYTILQDYQFINKMNQHQKDKLVEDRSWISPSFKDDSEFKKYLTDEKLRELPKGLTKQQKKRIHDDSINDPFLARQNPFSPISIKRSNRRAVWAKAMRENAAEKRNTALLQNKTYPTPGFIMDRKKLIKRARKGGWDVAREHYTGLKKGFATRKKSKRRKRTIRKKSRRSR